MKLVLVISSLDTGGAERVLSTLANTWSRRGWEITLITTHEDGSEPFYPVDQAVKLYPILLSQVPGGGFPSNMRRIRELRRVIREEAPDGVVSFLNYTNILVLMACIGLDLPVVVSERLDPRVHQLPRAWATLRRLFYRKAHALVNQTEAAASFFRPWLKEKVHIIPNPVIPPGSTDIHCDVDLPDNSIVAMGRLHPQKGFSTLLEAMAKVHELHPEWNLTVLGEGPLRQELEGYRDQLDLAGVVSFPGRVRRPDLILKQAQIFVLSSVTEGFPNVLCEAMSAGLPVISTNCPSGPEEILLQGKVGLLVPVNDPCALAKALVRLVEDSSLRESLGQKGAQEMASYSLERIVSAWDNVFEVVGLH